MIPSIILKSSAFSPAFGSDCSLTFFVSVVDLLPVLFESITFEESSSSSLFSSSDTTARAPFF